MIDKNIFNTNYTISAKLFSSEEEPWHIIPKIKDYIIILANSLDKNHYQKLTNNIWVGQNVQIDANVNIIGPCIIDDNTIIRNNAYIRENVIIGKNCVIGSSEIKNTIIFDNSKIPHLSYVGDSIIGANVNLGAGVVISNYKNDGGNIIIRDTQSIDTGLKKMGALIGDNTKIGCNSVILPGTIINPNVSIYPLVRVRGIIEASTIVKDTTTHLKKEDNK